MSSSMLEQRSRFDDHHQPDVLVLYGEFAGQCYKEVPRTGPDNRDHLRVKNRYLFVQGNSYPAKIITFAASKPNNDGREREGLENSKQQISVSPPVVDSSLRRYAIT